MLRRMAHAHGEIYAATHGCWGRSHGPCPDAPPRGGTEPVNGASNTQVALWSVAIGGVFLTLVGTLIGERWNFSAITQQSWAGWGFLAFASATAYGAFVWLINNAPMSLVSTYAYVNPVIAVFLGLIILNEAITVDRVVLVVSGERRSRALLDKQPL